MASLAPGYATLVIFPTSVPGYLDAAGRSAVAYAGTHGQDRHWFA